MANPGYPQQPMQPQPMHQQPMGQMPHGAPAPVKRGTSKIVPVVVSAGLAVGTFCGLLFGVGTGEVDASPSSSEVKKDEPKQDDTPNPSASAKPTETKPSEVKPATPPSAGSATPTVAAGSAAPAAGSAAPAAGSAAPAAGSGTTTAAAGSGATTPPTSGAGSAAAKPTVAAAEPAVKKPKLTVEVTPESVAATAKITVDGKAIDSNAIEIDLGKDAKKEVKIVVKAAGYKTVEQKVEIDSDVAVKIELIKRPSAPAGGTRPNTGTPPKKKPPGGLIDI